MKKMLGSALTEESLGWRLSFESSIATNLPVQTNALLFRDHSEHQGIPPGARVESRELAGLRV
jgi:hypothetical protein